VEFKPNVDAFRVGLDRKVPFRGLTLVNSREPKAADENAWPAVSFFSAAEMRHNFAIWTLEKSGTSRRRLHVYYCVRCKWAFRVDDYSGSVTPLDQNGKPIREPESAERLATFGVGPCPVFRRLTEGARLTQVVIWPDVRRGRLAALFHAMSRIWRKPDRGGRRPASFGNGQN